MALNLDFDAFVRRARAAGLSDELVERAEALRVWNRDLGPLQIVSHLLDENAITGERASALLAAAPPRPDFTGRAFGRYRLTSALSTGAFGATYLAQHADLGLKAAVKVLHDVRDMAALRRESAELAAISHPGLARVQDFGVQDGAAFLVLEHVEGTRLSLSPRPDWLTLADWIRQVAAALRALHDGGLVHRNVTLGSLALQGTAVRFVDFGLAAAEDGRADVTGLAPEILRDARADRRSDLYALGAALYELVVRRPPFEAAGCGDVLLLKLRGGPPLEPLARSGAPPAVVRTITMLLEPRPDSRLRDADALLRELEPEAPSPAPAQARPRTARFAAAAPMPKPIPLVPIMVALAALVVIVATGVLVSLASRRTARLPDPVAQAPPPVADAAAPPPNEETRARVLAEARAAHESGRLEEALALYKQAHDLRADDAVAREITGLEHVLRSEGDARLDFLALEQAIVSLAPEDAIAQCDRFIATHPASRFVEKALERKIELRSKLTASRPPSDEHPPPETPPPAPPPPERITNGRAMQVNVLAALQWLARHQEPDGSWGQEKYVKRCSGFACGPAIGQGHYDTGLTALALLAFVSAGYAPGCADTYDGIRFGDVASKAADRLIELQDAEGCVGPRNSKYMYGHAIATSALLRAAGGDEPRRKAARRALDFLLAAQNAGKGWRYALKPGDNDTSVTGWAVAALRAAKAAGVDVPRSAWDGARAWILEATEPSAHRVGYTSRSAGKVFAPGLNEHFNHHETLTAIGVVIRVGHDGDRNATPVRAGLALLAKDPPVWRGRDIDFYYWHHAAEAMPYDASWKTWRERLRGVLAGHQLPGGCRAGSWDTVDRWSPEAGRVYATALNALTLVAVATEVAPPAAPPASPPAPIQWVFHLKSGGRLKVVSYEEKGDTYVIKLPGGGTTTISKEAVEGVVKYSE